MFFWEMFKIPTFRIPTFIIPIEKYSHNTNAPIIIPMPLSKYQCPIQNTHDARSKYQLNVRNTNKLKRVQFINSKYQQVGILNTVHNTNPSPQNNHLGACCCWAATSSRWQAWPCQEEERQEGRWCWIRRWRVKSSCRGNYEYQNNKIIIIIIIIMISS